MGADTTRNTIIEAADALFYERGFEFTSFADIAKAVNISRGNFYYHFKTKDDILSAVIDHRRTKTQAMLDRWEQDGDTPKARIESFIDILVMNRAKIKNFGCPVGTLCSELAKVDHPSQPEANALFTLFREWLRAQFVQLGLKKNADELAMYLLIQSQGVATLASAFHDEALIKREVKRIHDWLKTTLQNAKG